MTKTILTGVDDSATALRAAVKAAQLAVALDAELHLICAYGKLESEVIQSGYDEFHYSSDTEALKTARSVARKVQAEVSGVKIVPEAASGSPAAALVRAAREMDAEMIVVGNKRVQGFTRVLGSIARDVIAHAPCDVHVAYTHER